MKNEILCLKKVLLWGCYWQGNFGDDLMAVLFAKALKSWGVDVEIYGLDARTAGKHGIRVASNLDAAVADADGVILGGGAALKAVPARKMLLSPAARQIERGYRALAAALSRYQKPIYPVSIGTDGPVGLTKLSRSREELFASQFCTEATVRLPEDVELIAQYGVKGDYFPDFLFSTYRLLPKIPVENAGRLRVVINIPKRLSGSFQPVVRHLLSLPRQYETIFAATHTIRSGFSYEYLPNGGGGEDDHRVIVNDDPVLLAQQLRSVDVVVSSKLHLGLVGLAAGARFLSYEGHCKTARQMDLLGRQKDVFSVGQEGRLIRELSSLLVKKEASNEEHNEELSSTVAGALVHLERLKTWVKRL